MCQFTKRILEKFPLRLLWPGFQIHAIKNVRHRIRKAFFVVQLYGWQNIINILPHPPDHYQQIPEENSDNWTMGQWEQHNLIVRKPPKGLTIARKLCALIVVSHADLFIWRLCYLKNCPSLNVKRKKSLGGIFDELPFSGVARNKKRATANTFRIFSCH